MAFLTPEGDLSDADLEQLMALGIIPDKQSGLQDQLTQAQKLRYGSMPEMRGEGGRIQTAANPLEFLTAGVQGYRAGKDIDKLRKEQADLLKQQTQARKLFFDRLRGRTPPISPSGPGTTTYFGE